MDTQREPVLTRQIVSMATWIATVLVLVGILGNEEADQVVRYITMIAPVAAVVMQLFMTLNGRSKVTPIDDPRDNEGRPLTPDHAIEPA